MNQRNKALLKLSAMTDVFIDVIDECLDHGESPFLSEILEKLETINDKAFESNKDNITIQTVSRKLNYILNKEVK